MILVHAKAAVDHKLGGAYKNVNRDFMYIERSSVINAIPLNDSPAILILGTIAMRINPSNFR
jgi:hypothetical protein